jgi:predicted kinase
MLHDSVHLREDTERPVMAVRDAAVRALLRKGVDVIVDDTNLPSRTVRDLRRLATLAGADFAVVDLTDVSLEECLRRNVCRAKIRRTVCELVIR